jgi:fumarate reductase subunit D
MDHVRQRWDEQIRWTMFDSGGTSIETVAATPEL